MVTLPVTLGDPEPLCNSVSLSVLEGRFPITSLRTVLAAFCQSVHTLVPKCPLTGAEMSWCRSVLGPNYPDTSAPVPKCLLDTSALVPKCLGTEVSWVRSVRLPFYVIVTS